MHANRPVDPARARLARRALPSLALLLGGLAPAADVGAIRNWCRTDPLAEIDGELADVFVSAPIDAPLLVTGPNRVVLAVPEGVRARVILNDLGFGRGTETAVEESRDLRATDRGIEVRVEVRVPASDDAMPVRVEFAPRVVGILWPARTEGTANEWIRLRTAF